MRLKDFSPTASVRQDSRTNNTGDMMRTMLLGAALAVATTCGAADEQIPIESFFKLAQYSAMAISPDGVHIAALAPVNGRQNLVVLDLEHKKGMPLTQLDKKDIVFFAWLTSK